MRLMTAESLLKHCEKYKIQIFVRDGVLKIKTDSLDNITNSLKKLLELHRDVLYSHFGA